MPTSLEVLFTPAEFAVLRSRDLSNTVCVVFDVLRATSSMVTALANGAKAIIPVVEISEALAIRRQRPEILLAGERNGVRIRSDLTGGTDFDLANSPREYTAEVVRGRTIVATTTNGTRALRACASARVVLVSSFLNLRATAEHLETQRPSSLMLVCSGTMEAAAYEDVLAAGAFCELIWPRYGRGEIADSAEIAWQLYRQAQSDLFDAMKHSWNARRLLAIPDLRDDVAVCLQRNVFDFAATLQNDRVVKID